MKTAAKNKTLSLDEKETYNQIGSAFVSWLQVLKLLYFSL